MNKLSAVTVTQSLRNQEWYQALIEDCAAVITEGVFQSKWLLIETYHLLGRRLLQEYDEFERVHVYGERITEMVAQDLGKSQRTVERAVQFARAYPDLNALPGGKKISWHWICNHLLPAPKDGKNRPVTFYDGIGRLAHHGADRWAVVFEPDSGFEGGLGKQVHVIIKEGP